MNWRVGLVSGLVGTAAVALFIAGGWTGLLALAGLAPFMFVAFLTYKMMQLGTTQKLLVQVNVPANTSLTALPMLLDNNDLLIFKALLAHGKLDLTSWMVTYAGAIIYHKRDEAFKLGGNNYAPRQLKVVKIN